MGIHDRSYAREPAGRPSGGVGGGGFGDRLGRSGVGGITVTTWLIIVNVAVFAIDGFLPKGWHPIAVQRTAESTARSSDLQGVATQELGRGVRRTVLVDRRDGSPAGVAIESEMGPLKRWGHFSTASSVLWIDQGRELQGFQFWRFLTYQFLHADMSHILFNMIGLFFFGPIVERHLGRKRYLAFYLLCGVIGALTYLVLNGLGIGLAAMGLGPIRFLLFNDPYTPLIGASASVFGILMAGAFLVPNATVLLFFVLPMRLATLAYALVALSIVTLFFRNTDPGSNAGGEAAHLGGAIAGFYFIRHTHHLHGFFDLLGRADPTSRSARARRSGAGGTSAKQAVADAEIDRILDKISRDGIQSLSRKERDLLRRASRRD